MNKLELLEKSTAFVLSAGVGSVLGNAFKVATPPKLNPLQKVSFEIGKVVISTYVSEHLLDYVNDSVSKAYAQFKEKQEETETEKDE